MNYRIEILVGVFFFLFGFVFEPALLDAVGIRYLFAVLLLVGTDGLGILLIVHASWRSQIVEESSINS